MAGNDAVETQISTADVQPGAVPPASPPQSAPPLPPQTAPEDPTAAGATALYGPGGPMPEGTEQAATTTERAEGLGVEGETIVWEGRYSLRNFMGRFILGGVLLIAWLGWLGYTYPFDERHPSGWLVTFMLGALVAVFLLALIRRVILARYGHFYRLTNRRLFVSTGLFNRRRDQMELLRIKDVYTKQSMAQRLLSLGSVVVVSSEQHFPMLYLTGVDDPKGVMDLVWHHARAERDGRSAKVEPV